jgi:histidine triad (HIT) family protein
LENCIFCKIISGKIPSKVVYEDEEVFAFHDINPIAPVHILIIPRKHISTLNDIGPEHRDLMGRLALVSKELARQHNIDERGYRLVINCGEEGGQEVQHLHAHLLGGRPLGGVASN